MSGRGRQQRGRLKLSEDRKVSPRGSQQPGGRRAGRWVPGLRNSFGLPAGASCPGRTEWCAKVCYATKSENSAGVGSLVHDNLRLLQEAGTTKAMAKLLGDAVGRFVREADRLALTGRDRMFRIHWDGDFFSIPYARAWAATMRAWPTVQFWAYTRSFRQPVDVVPILAGVTNLALYLSADEHNIEAALLQVEQYPQVRLALCADDYNTARALSPDRRAIVCPENTGRLELMAPDPDRPGNGKGACVTCGLCPAAKVDIVFSATHRDDAAAPPGRRVPLGEPIGRHEYRCEGPACDYVLTSAGVGRRRKYHSAACRYAAYDLARKARA